MMKNQAFTERVEAMRRFNRFYTRRIGVLHDGLLRSPFPLTEARVIFELAQHERITATELNSHLGLDPGYLSRILRRFRKRGLIDKKTSQTDGRQSWLWLTEKGKNEFLVLNSRSVSEIGSMLEELPVSEQKLLLAAMQTIERLLGGVSESRVPYILRPHQPGDMGWVVRSHGLLYSEEYGWDETFEALVAGIVSGFIENYNPKRERCWMAEMDGEIVGSVFIVEKNETTAKLRLLLVDPRARGLGIGKRLVDECLGFCRRNGYQSITLWTNSILLAARHIYEKAGFQLVHEEAHHSFGHDLVGETWELDL